MRCSGVWRSIASGSSGEVTTRSQTAGPSSGVGQREVSGLGHRAGVEGTDLVSVRIGSADETGGVLGSADEHRLGMRGHEVSGQASNRVVLNKETRKKWRHPVSTRRSSARKPSRSR